MKFGQNPQKQWHSSADLNLHFNRFNKRLNRLMILDHVWTQLIGNKSKFWVLKAIQKDTLYVQANLSVARSELLAKRAQLIKELNKHFDTPWIKRIEIQ